MIDDFPAPVLRNENVRLHTIEFVFIPLTAQQCRASLPQQSLCLILSGPEVVQVDMIGEDP